MTTNISKANRLRIDIHAHVWTPEYLNLMQKFGKDDTEAYRTVGAGMSHKEINARFEMMAKADVAIQILSATPLSPHFKNKAHAVESAIFINNQYAEIVNRMPDKFMAFASLPLPHIKESLTEIKRALDELGMAGICATTAVLGKSLADAHFEPIFKELNNRKAILFIHPEGYGAYSHLIQDDKLTWLIGAPIEDTICVTQLITNGIPSRYPAIKIINSHLGGSIPMLMQRMDNQYGWEKPETPEKPSIAAKRMWYDSVGHGHIPALKTAVDSFGADRILFGTDFPYEKDEEFQRSVDFIVEGLSSEDADQILDKNAAQIFGLLSF